MNPIRLNVRHHLRNQDIPLTSVGHSNTALDTAGGTGSAIPSKARFGSLMPVFAHTKTETTVDDAFAPNMTRKESTEIGP
jgi:hypothetical protein